MCVCVCFYFCETFPFGTAATGVFFVQALEVLDVYTKRALGHKYVLYVRRKLVAILVHMHTAASSRECITFTCKWRRKTAAATATEAAATNQPTKKKIECRALVKSLGQRIEPSVPFRSRQIDVHYLCIRHV